MIDTSYGKGASSWWRRFHCDEFGTSVTEFVILLPVFIIIFAGVVNLGRLEQSMVETEIKAYLDTFERGLEVQTTSLQDDLSSPHITPSSAGTHAIAQLSTRLPRQEGVTVAAVTRAEERAYSLDGLVQSGHWGESFARLRGPNDIGVRFRGLGPGAVTPTPEEIMGLSHLSRSLFFDGPSGNFNGSSEVNSGEQPALQALIDKANEQMSMVGGRGVVAANMRYGTVTGESEATTEISGRAFEDQSYYTLSVAPYHNSDENGPWWDQLRAVSVSRVTLSNSRYDAYHAVFGFTEQPCNGNSNSPCLGLPDPEREVPGYDDIPFTAPIDYDKTTLSYMNP